MKNSHLDYMTFMIKDIQRLTEQIEQDRSRRGLWGDRMFRHLFSGIEIGRLKLDNRLVVPPMVVNMFDEAGIATEQYMAYLEARAKGGFGLIITENLGISPEARAFARNGGIWNDAQLEMLKDLTARIHQTSAKIAAQLYHAGRETFSGITGTNNVAPSPLTDPTMAERPRELTLEQIAAIVSDFGSAAHRAKEAGFDAVEVHCAHGYLINQFLSPFSNKRTDAYGGPFFNRTRIVREIIREVRRNIGDEMPILCRISVEELINGGMTVNDMVAVSLMLEAEGVNAIDVSFGVFASGGRIAASLYAEHGGMTGFAAQIKRAVSVPVVAVGRINDPHYAEAILAKGDADMIAIGRGSFADPDFPNKAKNGRLEDIAYCLGCRQVCNANLFSGKPISCLINPVCGRESAEVVNASVPKKILVIGGGPAGMQFAATAAERGHRVTLVEQADRVGGQWLLAMAPPNKQEFAHLITHLSRRLEAAGVSVQLNTKADPQDFKKYDRIVVATGGTARKPEIPINRNVLTEKDALLGKESGNKVFVLDLGGNAAQTAAFLGAQGKQVQLIAGKEPHERYGDGTIDQALQKTLADYQVARKVGGKIISVDPDAIVLADEKISLAKDDSVVICTGYQSINDIPGDLVIGDARCIANGTLAIMSAYEAALEI